ncbi:MAG: mechanosensitive ion channel [Rhodocyclaceae bacterium]|nr:mechanosensitive ion channel [Rhodocyclaceae bacterium]
MEKLASGEWLQSHVWPWAINVALAIAIFVAGRWLAKLLVSLAGKLLRRGGMDEMLAHFVLSILHGLLLLLVVVAALNRLGVDTTSLVAIIGAAGLAIGLSLQDSLKNFAAGVMLIVFRPFKAGDFVEAAGTMGTVEKINIFSSTFRTADNREIIIPNGAIYSGVITNYSARSQRRIDLIMSIGYDDDIRAAKQVIDSVLRADERVLTDPEPFIGVAELGASSVNIHVRPWVASSDFFAVGCDLKEKLKLAFDDHGISIPFPQMDLHHHRRGHEAGG